MHILAQCNGISAHVYTLKNTQEILQISTPSSTSRRPSHSTKMSMEADEQIAFSVKCFYWGLVTWNMSAIYGLLIIHIWDIGTDIAVMVKWYRDGKSADPQWISSNGDIDLLALFLLSILFILLYRIIASLMIYSLTQSPLRVFSQLVFDFEIYRTIFISFKLRLSEPGYIQTWLQKLEVFITYSSNMYNQSCELLCVCRQRLNLCLKQYCK